MSLYFFLFIYGNLAQKKSFFLQFSSTLDYRFFHFNLYKYIMLYYMSHENVNDIHIYHYIHKLI